MPAALQSCRQSFESFIHDDTFSGLFPLAGFKSAGALQLRDQEGAGEMHGDDGAARSQL